MKSRRSSRSRASLEQLEHRYLMCVLHTSTTEPVELAPNLVEVSKRQVEEQNSEIQTVTASEPADIVWVNRGSGSGTGGDRFGDVFGANADLARAVVDAVILSYERMIGSFNYSSLGITYSLTVQMSSSGSSLGASAGLNSTFGGKPQAGVVTMGRGGGGTGGGWFLDPTPFESSEFQGNLVNAFSGHAQTGSPASAKSDFFTVVAAEVTHCMGLYGGLSVVPLWDAMNTNTGVPDTAEGGGIGTFWAFRGPSIKHLLTGNNGGGGGNSFPGGVHAAGPNVPVVFDGDTYLGAQDQGNAVYEQSRRYMINETFALMFKDAYGYGTNAAATWGTTFSSLNETTKNVLVRGGDATSGSAANNDRISITRSGSTITVSVDPTIDLPGTGLLPGNGDLPAWVTTYDISQVNSITIQAGAGNDTITLGTNLGVPVTIDGSTGTDTLKVVGTTGADTATFTSASVTLSGNTQTVTSIENVSFDGLSGDDVVTINSGPTVTFPATQRLASLTMAAATSAAMTPGIASLLVTKALSMNATAKLDLFDEDMIFDYSAGSQLADVQALINTARAAGAWTGNGLTSTTAKNNAQASTTLGAMEASDYKAYWSTTTFDGESVDDTAVVIKYAYYGDADMSGKVDLDDYGQTDGGFLLSNTGWLNGDFDGLGGKANLDDYSLIDGAFLTQGPTL
ncbi:MAG: hypothetical protein ACREJC_08870 [Tepidisphaeraceae bacterium]